MLRGIAYLAQRMEAARRWVRESGLAGPLLEALRAAAPAARTLAAHKLGFLREATAFDALVAALRADEPAVRCAAAGALGC